MKKLIGTLVLLGLVVGAWLYWRSHDVAAADVISPDDSYKVARGSIFDAVASTGAVTSNLDVDIKCQASGEVTLLPYDISQTVKKDQVLMRIDPTLEQQALQAAQINVNIAQAKLEQARENELVSEQTLSENTLKANADFNSATTQSLNTEKAADRQKELVQQNLGSEEEYETAQTQAASAKDTLATAKVALEDLKAQQLTVQMRKQDVVLAQADYESAKVALDQAKLQLSYCTVPSPMDGVVSALDVQVGSMVASSISNVGGGTTVMTISDLSHIYVLASVDESDIGKVRNGQDVIITADSYPGVKFGGKVVRIATTGVNTSNVVTFQVKIEVTSKNKDLLKPVMTTNVQIVANRKADVLTVPVQALDKDGRKFYATVLDGDKPAEKEVKVGMTDGESYEVVAGLNEGDMIELHKNDVQSRWNADKMMRRMGNPIMRH
ncbi:MAG TPA: efflux RND transporter periplasmic adaptor subunit [Tepidisphaeraceae bacterium]